MPIIPKQHPAPMPNPNPPAPRNILIARPAPAPAWPWLTRSFFQQAPAAVAPNAPSAELTWEEISAYVSRHIGMQQLSGGNWKFGIGEDFAPLPDGGDVKLDALIAQALIDIGILPSMLVSLINQNPGLFEGLNDDFLPEARAGELSRRIWAKLKDDPQVLGVLQIQLARKLQAQIRIKDINLGLNSASLSKKHLLTWTEISPYVRGAILLETRPKVEDGRVIGDSLLLYICAINNNMSRQISAEQIDGKVMETVVLAMIEEDQSGGLFQTRLQQAIDEAREKVKFQEERPAKPEGLSEEAYQARIKAQRADEVSRMTEFVYEKLSGDLAWKFTTLGFLNAAFEREKLPPIVLP